MPVQKSSKSPLLHSLLSRSLPAMLVVAVVAGGWFMVRNLNSNDVTEQDTAEQADAPSEESELTLSQQKIAQAKFCTQPSSVQQVLDVRTVPGRLTYDEAHHIEVKAPVSGVLVDVLVKPGDRVTDGQLLAVVNSPEIGRARAAVLNEQAKYEVVLTQVERLQEVTKNLQELFKLLDRGVPPEEIGQSSANKSLGTYREEIVAAYSERYLAQQLMATARPLADAGSMPLKTLRERENERHVAEARFRSARETAAYDVTIRRQQLEVDRNDAQRQVMIAQSYLATLLGFTETSTPAVSGEQLSRMEVRAPFAGTIEARTFAKRERVEPTDSLFVLANTKTLYVSADIRENEWAATSVQPGDEISVTVPALPDRSFVAKVHYVGREVARDSNSLPLIAIIGNAEGLLRPGMFVRVAIPVAQSGDVVAVPPQSVMQHENNQFVFVAVDEDTFRKVDVRTGVSNEQWVEIADGLQAGVPVVDAGAFLLKSELLLAGEED